MFWHEMDAQSFQTLIFFHNHVKNLKKRFGNKKKSCLPMPINVLFFCPHVVGMWITYILPCLGLKIMIGKACSTTFFLVNRSWKHFEFWHITHLLTMLLDISWYLLVFPNVCWDYFGNSIYYQTSQSSKLDGGQDYPILELEPLSLNFCKAMQYFLGIPHYFFLKSYNNSITYSQTFQNSKHDVGQDCLNQELQLYCWIVQIDSLFAASILRVHRSFFLYISMIFSSRPMERRDQNPP